jgi:hypothetical protein
MQGSTEFFEEYDAATDDVRWSDYHTQTEALRRWFYVLEQDQSASEIVRNLESSVDIEKWYNETVNMARVRMGVGDPLQWPLPVTERLGTQLSLFRMFAEGKAQAVNPFGYLFYRHRDQDFNGVTSNINEKLFQPLARDLRRQIARVVEPRDKEVREPVEVPASDRVVPLDHNSVSYEEAIRAVDQLEELVRHANDYDDADEKDQVIAELSAGRRLLQSVRVRIAAVAQVLASPVRALTVRFGTGLINQAAHDLWEKLTSLLGSGWHWPF